MSSNYRELKNFVDTIGEMECNDELQGVELFFFTDNKVAEATVFKGTSSSPIYSN